MVPLWRIPGLFSSGKPTLADASPIFLAGTLVSERCRFQAIRERARAVPDPSGSLQVIGTVPKLSAHPRLRLPGLTRSGGSSLLILFAVTKDLISTPECHNSWSACMTELSIWCASQRCRFTPSVSSSSPSKFSSGGLSCSGVPHPNGLRLTRRPDTVYCMT